MYQVRIICFIAVALALADPAMGAEMGLGVSFNSVTIDAPITLSPSFRIEPYISYHSTRRETPSSYTTSSSYSDYTFGAGFFATRRLSEQMKLFAGARVAYIRSKEDYFYPSTGTTASRNTSGYLIAPTIGVDYFVQANLSIGGEAAIFYSRRTGKDNYASQPFSSNGETAEFSTGTSTAVTIRYYFQ